MCVKENAGMADELKGEECPVCRKKTLILNEREEEIPYFGKTLLFSMTCAGCRFHKADIESVEKKEPCKLTIEVSGEQDMNTRVVKSSQATVKIPHIATITPGPASNGYVTNIEGILMRIKHQTETAKNDEEDNETRKKAIKLIKKINRVMRGDEKAKIIIEDPSGNSAILSKKTETKKIRAAQESNA